MRQAYTIKSLEWKRKFQSNMQTYTADVPGGQYQVIRVREDCEDGKPWQSWRWEYTFCEYYDEGTQPCDSAAQGRSMAECHWIRRILPALELAEEPKAIALG